MRYFLLAILLCVGQECISQSVYTYKNGSYDGIGKWYMGREIAHVMGYQGIRWLERPEREREERVSLLIENMQIQRTDVIADIGAGAGIHTFLMAEKASSGTVYAVDIQREMLEAITRKKEEKGMTNIKTVRSVPQSVNLPMEILDKVLLVDVYHEFEFPLEMMTSIRESLKPDGRVYLIEYRKEDPNVPIKELHKMSQSQAAKEMYAAGFELEQNISNLPWQHCMIFRKK